MHVGKKIGATGKTIMFVGATGSGKSTLVDGIINYITGVSWDEDFRFSMVDLSNDEKKRQRDQASGRF
jgi:ABC-type lipoprotein export system ATPase subunit